MHDVHRLRLQGGGEVIVKLPIIKEMPPISLTDEGMVKRIRGIAHSMKVLFLYITKEPVLP